MAYLNGEIGPKRIEAFAADSSLVIMVGIAVNWVCGYVQNADWLPFIAICLVITLGYFFPYLVWQGQTFGKRMRKVQLVNLDGSKCNMWKIAAREFFKVFLSIVTGGLYAIIAGLFLVFRKDERTIHDFIFRTKVIEKSDNPYDNYEDDDQENKDDDKMEEKK